MAIDFTQLLGSAPQLFRDLPFLMNLAQLIFYSGLILTFGGFVMRAYHGYLRGWAAVLGRVVFGFLALVTGVGISWVFPRMSDVMMYQVIQALFLDILIGGAIATGVLFLALKLVSYHIYNVRGIKERIDELEDMEEEARKAEHEDRAKHREGLHHPIRMAGLAVLAAFLVIGLVGFRGFPDPMEELGFTQQDLEGIADQLEAINDEYGEDIGEFAGDPERMSECMGAMDLLSPDALVGAQPYQDAAAEAMVESYAGEDVMAMYSLESGESFYIIALTQDQICLSTRDLVCLCRETG